MNKLLIFFTLIANYTLSQEINLNDYFLKQQNLVQAISKQVNCVYPVLLIRSHLIKTEEVDQYYAQPDANMCNTVSAKNLNSVIDDLNNERSTIIKTSQYPIFSDFIATNSSRDELAPYNLSTELYPPTNRFKESSILKNPMDIEMQLRKSLGISSEETSHSVSTQ
ncbi:MAG: hypothetical protein KDD45_08645, partial [Bdellovibrionales bacterium]|nr:hypothetical protein [Bdellovibrionales bacterium]